MRRPGLRFRIRHLMIGVAVAAVGLLLRNVWGRGDEILVRAYPGGWRPGSRGLALRIRLDGGLLRAHGLSREDVIQALTPSGIVDPQEPTPPPGVVFVFGRSIRPDQFDSIVLKADVEGHVVRLKDVGKVVPDR